MLSEFARHCIMLNTLCMSLIILAICVVLMEPLESAGHTTRRRLSLCLFANRSYSRAVNLLNLAFYPRHTTVNLFVVNSTPVADPVWMHGRYRHVNRMPAYDGSECLVLLDDTMQVSPVFGFWFLRACDRSVVSGGEAGLALSGRVWERFDAAGGSFQNVFAGVVEFIRRHNLTVVYPEFLGKGYTFVRSRWQSPIDPEQPPKLARGMDAAFFALR